MARIARDDASPLPPEIAASSRRTIRVRRGQSIQAYSSLCQKHPHRHGSLHATLNHNRVTSHPAEAPSPALTPGRGFDHRFWHVSPHSSEALLQTKPVVEPATFTSHDSNALSIALTGHVNTKLEYLAVYGRASLGS